MPLRPRGGLQSIWALVPGVQCWQPQRSCSSSFGITGGSSRGSSSTATAGSPATAARFEPGKCLPDCHLGGRVLSCHVRVRARINWSAGFRAASSRPDKAGRLPPSLATTHVLLAGEWQLAACSSLAAAVWARLDRKWLGLAAAVVLQLWQLLSMLRQMAD